MNRPTDEAVKRVEAVANGVFPSDVYGIEWTVKAQAAYQDDLRAILAKVKGPQEPTEAMARAAYEAGRGPDPHALLMRWADWSDLTDDMRAVWFEKCRAMIQASKGER